MQRERFLLLRGIIIHMQVVLSDVVVNLQSRIATRQEQYLHHLILMFLVQVVLSDIVLAVPLQIVMQQEQFLLLVLMIILMQVVLLDIAKTAYLLSRIVMLPVRLFLQDGELVRVD